MQKRENNFNLQVTRELINNQITFDKEEVDGKHPAILKAIRIHIRNHIASMNIRGYDN